MVILTETPPRKIADSLPGFFIMGKWQRKPGDPGNRNKSGRAAEYLSKRNNGRRMKVQSTERFFNVHDYY
jgi:hypothetical protein